MQGRLSILLVLMLCSAGCGSDKSKSKARSTSAATNSRSGGGGGGGGGGTPDSLARLGPSWCYTNGGTPVALIGTGFDASARVLFDGVEATGVNVVASNYILCTSPPHDEGLVDVQVVQGKGALRLNNVFTYKKNPSQYAANREVGAGFRTDLPSAQAWRHYATLEFAYTSVDRPFLTGVVYADASGDLGYQAGEGLGGVSVTLTHASGLSLTTQTRSGGGYAFEVLSPATFTLTLGGKATPVSVSGDSVKVDLRDGAVLGGGSKGTVNAKPGAQLARVADFGDPTGAEQEMLELMNEARRDPLATGLRLGVDLSGYPPTPPLVHNQFLGQAALGHVMDMANRAFYGHLNPDGDNANGRLLDTTYDLNARFGMSRTVNLTEAIGAAYGDQFNTPQRVIDTFLIDAGVVPAKHRMVILGGPPPPMPPAPPVQPPLPPPAPGTGFRTQTQGGWGTVAKGNNPGAYRDANFPTAFPNGLVVGHSTGYTATLTSSLAVQTFLPAGGSPRALTQNLVDPTSTPAGVFAGQVVALTLSVTFDRTDPNFGASATQLADQKVIDTTSPFFGMTVQQVLNEANLALAGQSAIPAAQLNECVSKINENYVDGTQNKGFLGQ